MSCTHIHAPTSTHKHTQSTSYSDTIPTGGTLGGYTSSSIEKSSDYDEDDEDEQLMLPDFEASQAYLSLGLTPLSQLSPDAANSNDFGFFPSMPPPVAPSSSIFSTSNSSIAMDSTFSLHNSGQSSSSVIDSSVMPDACPERRPRRGRHDTSAPLSQGFSLKLEPLPEQSPPMELHHDSVSGDQVSGRENGFASSDDSQDASPTFFKNQHTSPPTTGPLEFTRLSQGRTALRRKPAGQRKERDSLVPNRRGLEKSYGSFDIPRSESDRKHKLSPSQQAKLKRQQAKEMEIARQMEEQKRRQEQETRERQRQKDLRMAETSRDYDHSRRGIDLQRTAVNGLEAMNGGSTAASRVGAKFEAMEMVNGNYGRSAVNGGGSGSQSPQRSPQKLTPIHHRHSSLDETAGPRRLERSNSSTYTTEYTKL